MKASHLSYPVDVRLMDKSLFARLDKIVAVLTTAAQIRPGAQGLGAGYSVIGSEMMLACHKVNGPAIYTRAQKKKDR